MEHGEDFANPVENTTRTRLARLYRRERGLEQFHAQSHPSLVTLREEIALLENELETEDD